MPYNTLEKQRAYHAKPETKKRKREIYKRWYDKNCKEGSDARERKKATSRAYYIRNREKVLARSKKWALENPDKVRARYRRYAEKNQEKIREYQRLWAEKNKERDKDKKRRKSYKRSVAIQHKAKLFDKLMQYPEVQVRMIQIEMEMANEALTKARPSASIERKVQSTFRNTGTDGRNRNL